MATDKWLDNSDDQANWNTAGDWSGGIPGSSSDVVVGGGDPQVTASISVKSITDSAEIDFLDSGANHITGGLTIANYGFLGLDSNLVRTVSGDGGSSLAVDGLLTNSGRIEVGSADESLSGSDTLAVSGFSKIKNQSFAQIDLFGAKDATTGHIAELKVAGAAGLGAAGVVEGGFELAGDSLIEFGSQQITSISGALSLLGRHAFVADAGRLSSNSALTGLRTISLGGGLALSDGARLTTNGPLKNAGDISVDFGIDGNIDQYAFGGSSLTIGGALINSNQYNEATLEIGSNPMANDLFARSMTVSAASIDNKGGIIEISGNKTPKPGILSALKIRGAAGFGSAGVVEGAVGLAYDALIEFEGGGQIKSIAADATLGLASPDAFIADAGALTSNSALRGLTDVAGKLDINEEAHVTTTGPLTNSGTIQLDYGGNGPVDLGGGQLKIGGKLTNSGQILMDAGTASELKTPDSEVSAISLDNTGSIEVSYAQTEIQFPPFPGELAIRGAASNTGTITVGLNGLVSIGGPLAGAGVVDIVNTGAIALKATASGGTIDFVSGGGTIDMTTASTLDDVVAGFSSGDVIDFQALAYKSSYEAVWRPAASGRAGVLQIVDTAKSNSVVTTLHMTGALSGELVMPSKDAGGGIDIAAAAYSFVAGDPGDLIISNISGKGYSAYERHYDGDVLVGTDYFFTKVSGQAYSAYEKSFSAGGDLVGSKYLYGSVTGQPYTSEEIDRDGSGQATRVDFIGLTDQFYSSYENDYVGGVLAGSKDEYTQTYGVAYSSYEKDYDPAGAYIGEKFFYTNVRGQAYSGEEQDDDANGNLVKDILTGVAGKPYTSIEKDYKAGTYAGDKEFFIGIKGQIYTGEEKDYSAANQLLKVIDEGIASRPYSSVEYDYASNKLADKIYDYTDVTGRSYYAYQVQDSSGGVLRERTYDLIDGGHQIVGHANGLAIDGLGDDTMTGGGSSENFVLDTIFGHDAITDFAAHDKGAGHDMISLSKADFKTFDAMMAAATNSSTNVVVTAKDGDTLTLDGLSKATLATLAADFTFHS